MPAYRIDDQVPQIDEAAYVAPGAHVMGLVEMRAQSSVWFGAVLRGDNEPIRLGARSNVQEGAVLHADPGFPLTIGEDVTVGHQAMLHGCTIGDGSLIGIQAVVLNGARIGRNCLIGAGALVTEGKEIPDGSVVLGSPGKVVRQLTEADIANLRRAAESYVERSQRFRERLQRLDGQPND